MQPVIVMVPGVGNPLALLQDTVGYAGLRQLPGNCQAGRAGANMAPFTLRLTLTY